MGMFDYLKCECPLPENPSPWQDHEIEFQTKDTPEQYLKHYKISADGYLFDEEGKLVDFTDAIEFYTGNVVASGPGVYTKDGEDAIWVEYKAVFVHGKLTHIELVKYTAEPAQKSSDHWHMPTFTSNFERSAWWDKERKAFEEWREAEKARRLTAK